MSANDYAPCVFTCPICKIKSNGLCLKPACIAAIKAQQEATRPIAARIIALNETSHYYLEPEEARFIQAIKGVYLYDHNRHFNCCELTPSYYLIFLYNSVNLTDEGQALDDKAKGELYDKFEAKNDSEDCYMHTHTVDQLAEKADPSDYYIIGDLEICKDSSYNEQIEELVEYFRSNWVVG